MTSLLLVWTTVTCVCWTSGSAQDRKQQETHYPVIHSTQTLVCACPLSCDTALWFRRLEGRDGLEFLVSVNSAERNHFNKDLDTTRFKATMRDSSTWALHITNVTQEDTGVYSCVVKNKRTEDVSTPGVLLLPGVTAPTPQPEKPACSCPKNSHKPHPNAPRPTPVKGCGSVVMWPLVGVLAGLVTALLSTLYYFSRLPKKCRHQFEKRQMR